MKTKISRLRSSKLFYKKWPYKIECTIFGAYLCGHFDLDLVKKWCKNPFNKPLLFSYGSANIDKQELLEFVKAVEGFKYRQDVQIRTERNKLNLFCADKTVLEDIETKLFKWIRKISGPTTDEELNFLLNQGHKQILCDILPKDQYRYRIYFKTSWPQEGRYNFLLWTTSLKDKISISKTSEMWFKATRLWTQDPFMYIEDEKTLTLISLYCSNYIRKIEKFVLRHDILV